MFPAPKTIIGDKKTLLDSYNKQVAELETTTFSKKIRTSAEKLIECEIKISQECRFQDSKKKKR